MHDDFDDPNDDAEVTSGHVIDLPVSDVHFDDGIAFAMSDLSCCFCSSFLMFLLSFCFLLMLMS